MEKNQIAKNAGAENRKYVVYYNKAEEGEANIKGELLKDVEIFRTGVFRRQLFDKKYLKQMVENFNLLKEKDVFRDVPVREGHVDMFGMDNPTPRLIGYINSVRLKNNGKTTVKTVKLNVDMEEERMEEEIDDVRIVADLEITEPEAMNKIKRTTYRNRSIEWGGFMDNDGDIYDPVLQGVAFVDIPQVDKLNVIKFSKYNDMTTLQMAELNKAEDKKEELEKEPEKKEGENIVEEPKKKEVIENPETEKEEKGEEKPEDKKEEPVEDPEKKESEDIVEEPKEEEEEPVELQKANKELTIEKLQKEIDELKTEKFQREMNDKLTVVQKFAHEGHSTKAMLDLEEKLIKSFYAKTGGNDYLSPDNQFELFKKIKESTPKVWEKKEEFKKLNDEEELQKLKKQSSDTNTVTPEVREAAKELIREANLQALED